MQYIGYYRVSTTDQGTSGLGIEAQQATVRRYAADNVLLAEYTDIESGKNNNRPELQQALQMCKNTGATLLIAKLDRLSRNLSFISLLMDSGARFKCCDMPEANEMTIHIMAVMAQAERKAISERTKSALSALQARGVKLGNPANMTGEGRNKAIKAIKAKAASNVNNQRAAAMVKLLRESGNTLKEIAEKLNGHGFATATGKAFTPTQVSRLLPQPS